ncbi:MAG: hypothetical protein R3Y19_07975 [Rikenellaceae bacterium]
MRKSRYITYLLLTVFIVHALFRLSIVLLCDCHGHTHNSESVCRIDHSHDSEHKCHSQESIMHCCGLHFQDFEYEAVSSAQQISKQIAGSVSNLLCTPLSDQSIDPQLTTLKKENHIYCLHILGQWDKSPLRQRPPPVLV